MADSVVSSIVSFAVDNLSRLLVGEVKLLSSMEDDITSLRNDLKFMVAFLKNSEGNRNNESVKEMADQIRQVAFQSEDAIDTYVANVARHKSLNKLRMCFYCTGHVAILHELNAQVKAIKSTLKGIYRNKVMYGIDEHSGTTKGRSRWCGVSPDQRRRRDVEEREVVGLVHEFNVVMEKLMEPDPNLNVVSIIGIGGLGKTTLVRKIYNKDEVKSMFDCCAWKSSIDECKDLSVDELKKRLSECLKGKKYLVELDDIWKTQCGMS
ncbi:hypothetical protein Ahy_A04g017212 [Arachis hypogaea]|uniref:NB-ARC domain-containing protein n=1 Tax=Arachis hypogaea TaxID=3818 RepID=A0A445DAC6_ARAHY|nr:hypothetical protein Ahy_A04g017212 [Arachis hypogaea]